MKIALIPSLLFVKRDSLTRPLGRLCALLFSVLVFNFSVQAVNAQGRIMIVTDAPEMEVEGAGNLGDFLRSLGYTVDADPGNPDQNEGGNSFFRDPLTQDKIELLESYDLVLVHRSTGSGGFDESATAWNQLQVPLLHGSSYMVRNDPNRWNWVDGSQNRAQDTGFEILEGDHPIVKGLDVDVYNRELDFDHVTIDNGVGNGKLIAIVPASGNAGIIVWDEPGAFFDGGDQTHEFTRVFFPMLRYFEANCNCSFEDYSDNGLDMIAAAVAFTIGGEDFVPPPLIADLTPKNNSIGADPSNGITFTAVSDQVIPIDGIRMTVNGVDVSSDLAITGADTARQVQYQALEANRVYTTEITVANEIGTRSKSLSFDTFGSDVFTIEAEDFNFSGGGFFDEIVLCNDFGGVIDGCFFDRVSLPGVDAADAQGFLDDSTDVNNLFRFGPGNGKTEEVDTTTASDTVRTKYENLPEGPNGPILDYAVERLNPGDWQNYTRTIEAGTYAVYLRASASTDQEVQLGLVSNPSQANQTVETIGTFKLTERGYKTIPLTSIDTGILQALEADGKQTFRLTTLDGSGLKLNYFFLAPFVEPTAPPVERKFDGITLNADGTVTVTWTGGTLQSATAVTGPYSDDVGTSPLMVAPAGNTFYRIAP